MAIFNSYVKLPEGNKPEEVVFRRCVLENLAAWGK